MLKPVAMRKLTALILSKYSGAVTQRLGDLGLVHLVDAVDRPGSSDLAEVSRGTDLQQLEELHRTCSQLCEQLGLDASGPGVPGTPLSVDDITGKLTEMASAWAECQTQLNGLMQESGLLLKTASRLQAYPLEHTRIDALRDLNHLYVVTGTLSPSLLPALDAAVSDRAFVLTDARGPSSDGKVMIVTSRRSRWALESDLKTLGFVTESLPEDLHGSPADECDEIEDRLESLRLEILKRRVEAERLATQWEPDLRTIRSQLKRVIAVMQAQENFLESDLLTCITGWLPTGAMGAVQRTVDEVTQGTGIVEFAAPDESDVSGGSVPVQLEASPVLKPFQAIIGNFGSPRYNDLDPSLFVAFSFVLMFGLMFGDVGHGLVVVAFGLWLRRARHSAVRAFRDAWILLVLCGGSATLFGFLYGSVFGYENSALLKPIWLSPMHDVTRLLGAAVLLGVISISAAILLNIVNKVRNRRWFDGVFDKFGVLGIVFYWGALGIGLKAARTGELDAPGIVVLVVVPLSLLFIREPLHNLLKRRTLLHEGFFTFILEASVEILETLTTFLGSTVSFVRLGAFALSHAALCLAIYSMADILRDLPGGTFWCVPVLVLGNLLVIVMEGTVAMIQGIRLEYYELFSKYFPGDGKPYVPFTLSDPQNDENPRRQ